MARTYNVVQSDEQIDEVLNKASDLNMEGRTKWHGMTYEQGVEAAIRWLLEEGCDNPMED